MAEGFWFAIGSAIAAAGPVIVAAINAWSSRSKPDYFDKKATEVLRRMLDRRDAPWVNLTTLTNAVGLSPKETTELLLLAGARGHASENQWGLISHVGNGPDAMKDG